MMLELKGDVYTCMGCVDGKELITYKIKNNLYVESFERMWRRLSDSFEIKHQYSETNPNLYMDLSEVTIYDTEKDLLKQKELFVMYQVNGWMWTFLMVEDYYVQQIIH